MSGREFAPCPGNPFHLHVREYFDRCREACPQIEAITGKWDFEDLIPGLSDFDARFIFSNDTTALEWPEISRAVGRVHTAICREHPGRARILEHLPGINLTWSELLDPLFYYPEFHQWTTYYISEEFPPSAPVPCPAWASTSSTTRPPSHLVNGEEGKTGQHNVRGEKGLSLTPAGEKVARSTGKGVGGADKAARFERFLAERPWDDADELYTVKRFATYFTPYDRAIDPPINLHEFESKYPLHSRFMHYFCPPVQSLVSLKLKRMVRGKLEAFRLARELFPNPEIIDLTFDVISRHYETPELYEEPRLSELEDTLYRYLIKAFRETCPDITVIGAAPDDTFRELREKLGRFNKNILEMFFDGTKFCRLMMGRILFYAEEIPHFDSAWLIGHELRRDRKMFFESTFSTFALIAWGEEMTPEASLERCRGEFLNDSEIRDIRGYADIFAKKYETAKIKAFAVEVADTMAPFQVVMEKLGTVGRRIAVERGMG